MTKSAYRRMSMELGVGKIISTRINELAHLHEQDEQEHMPQKHFAAAIVPPSAVFSQLPLDDDAEDMDKNIDVSRSKKGSSSF